ncbi:MAG TPA: hypothetical protein DCS07_05980 [Bdellovibrionales bacterium]|nr:MAG: hypothetical protein A2Z97_13030 [Bdellovibrionales bacterium GWB1_52_6]OFZ05756.1 MAG: hypothetical protein A2X97_03585 [Bdellovibrionales bacterium GWA1_52_35]OFZ37807.1 MAG: hypothetical protein A2070_03535 [Bdellovibrionales bacterium GWC1_52_8]HAR42166.1 hypothetical protein [Bdellovibrionales bacterium]HCM40303.1 hypothetical protein [Bdellovibrionales bacterium]
MKTTQLTLTDRLGIAYGTLLFFIMLPVTIFASALPAIMISNAISNKVLALALNLGVIGVGALMTLIFALVGGLALSYGLSWAGRKLQIQQAFSHVKSGATPIEASKRVNLGAMLGIGFGLLVFITKGEAPISSVTTRVEHLFPGPLTLSLGNAFSLDVSHTYAAATGFLSVGFLFAIIGIVLGSLIFAGIEMVTQKSH